LNLTHSIFCTKTKSVRCMAVMDEAAEYVANFNSVKPQDIMNTIRSDYGVHSSYSTVWRGLNQHKQFNLLEDDSSFMMIKGFMQKLEGSNPGTITSLEFEQDGVTFKRAFLCPRSNQLAFVFCRPMIIVDACHLRSRYGGVIMSACAHDGEGKIVPLAVGIAEVENESNWTYFLCQLSISIPEIMNEGLVVMHDREKGLQNAQFAVLPNSYQSICVFHLEKNLNARFKSKFQGKVWSAAKAFKQGGFEEALADIGTINADAETYLRHSNPTLWARSVFPVPRFGCTTSNSAESLNSWMEPLRSTSHLNLLIKWVSAVSGLWFKKTEELQSEKELLTKTVQKKLVSNIQDGNRMHVVQFSETGFQVFNPQSNRTRIVDLKSNECSCGEFKEFMFPCRHAATAISKLKRPHSNYMHASYLKDSLCLVYGIPLIPVDMEDVASDSASLPPNVKRKAGRPKTVRIRSRGEMDEENQLICSSCGQKGHNKRTCDKHQAKQAPPPPLSPLPPLSPVAHSTSVAAIALGPPIFQPRKKRTVRICEKCGLGHYKKTICTGPSLSPLSSLSKLD
jgi:zinc finger SWIM domain-containing protein 3